MKRVPVLSVVLALLILGGFLLLFPLEWVGLLVLLLVLIAAQVVIVRRHLFPAGAGTVPRAAMQPPPESPGAARAQPPPPTGNRAPAAGEAPPPVETSLSPSAAGEAEPAAAAPPPPADRAPASGAAPADGKDEADSAPSPFSPELFSRFREHLEAAERAPETDPGAAPQESPGEPEAAEEAPAAVSAAPEEAGAEDRVVLSAAARRKAQAPPAAAMEPPAGEPAPAVPPAPQAGAGAEDLFDDLRPQPVAPAPEPEAAPPASAPPASAPPASAPQGGKGGPARAAPASGGGADEVQASLSGAQPGGGPRQEEGAMLLKMAEDALDQHDRAGAQAGLEQALALYEALPGGVPWRARMVQARLAVMDGDVAAAVAAYAQFLQDHPDLEEADALAPVEQLAAPLEGEQAAALRVSLLLKALAVLRQANDRRGMDRIYDRIAAAQEQAGDDRKLIQTYKNHLEIKRVLQDVEGQLSLIDRIGNRYYKLGDTKTAREFYEQGMKLRGEQEAAADAAKAGEA